MMKANFQDLLNQKTEEYEKLFKECQDMKDFTQQVEQELEDEINDLTLQKERLVNENEKVQYQLQELKKKYTSETSFLEKKMDRLTSQNESLKADLSTKNRLVIQSEIEIERLESQLRESQMNISDLEAKIDQTIEKLAMVQSQLEMTKAYNEEEIQRLKDQIQDSQSEALAFKAKEQMTRTKINSTCLETARMVDLSKISGHYQAYEGNGGNNGADPLPQKRRKLDDGRKIDEDSVYDSRENFQLDFAPTSRKSKRQGGARNKKLSALQQDNLEAYCEAEPKRGAVQNLHYYNMMNQGCSETLLLLNSIVGDLKKDTSAYHKVPQRREKQKKNVADLFAQSYANMSVTSLV